MKCPKCGTKTFVTSTVSLEGVKRRYRECANEHKFVTIEAIGQVIVKDGKPVEILYHDLSA